MHIRMEKGSVLDKNANNIDDSTFDRVCEELFEEYAEAFKALAENELIPSPEAKKSENHVEIINGVEVIQERTSPTHNIAVTQIMASIKNHISSNDSNCEVFTQSVALYVNELCGNNDLFLPDVMVVRNKEGISDDGVHTTPLFVAEVTSEITRQHDYGRKKDLYKAIGVEEYWIVDIQHNIIEKNLLSKKYIPDYYMCPEAMKITVFDFVMDVSGFIK